MISCLHPQLQSNSLSQPVNTPWSPGPTPAWCLWCWLMSIVKQRPPGQQFSPFHPHTLVPLTCSSSVMVLTGLACSLSSGQRGRLSLRTGRGSVLGAGGLKGSVSLALKEGRRPLLLPTRSLSGPISGQGNGRSHHPQQSLTC